MIVADTHALIWWTNGAPELSRAAKAQLDSYPVGVAAISCWEVAFLAARNRISLNEDVLTWLRNVISVPRLELLPLTPEIAVVAADLPDSIRDPADRLIVATAYHQQVPLVTKDGRIRAANVVETIW